MKKIFSLFIFIFTFIATIFSIPMASPVFADEWPTSLHDLQRTASSNDIVLNSSNVSSLTQKWNYKTGGPIAAAPIVSGNTIYVGSWDGNMYALDGATGTLKWKTFLGVTTANPICIPPMLGISSSATVQNGVVYVGGGDSNWYALDAGTGNILWSVPTGDNSAMGGHYNWSSPLIYNGYAYIGVASLGDCPLAQGLLLKVDLSTHFIVGVTKIVPDGQVGGGIWQSPSIDTATNRIFVATGTENSPTQQYAQAMLAIDANTMQIVDSWKLPESQAILDSDFSTTATLFTDSNNRNLVAAINKNGKAYAFDRNNLSLGPVWVENIAIGDDCPTCGASSVSSPTFNQGKIFFSGAAGTINGYTYPGTVRAIDPTTGNYIWQYGATGPIIPALASENGLIFDSAKSVFEVLDATNGNRLFSYDTGAQIYSPATISNGTVYVGNLAGNILAFGLLSPSSPPPDSNCPTDFTCQDVGGPSPVGSESVSSGIWTIHAGGTGFAGVSDSGRIMTKAATGNAQVSARLTSISSGQGGIMLRQSNDPKSQYFGAIISPNNELSVIYRKSFGGATSVLINTNLPQSAQYIAIERIGDTFQAATSPDGNAFTVIQGTTTSFAMPTNIMSGLAVSSGNQGTQNTVSLANVVVSAPVAFQPQPSSNPCPTNWQCQDVGNPITIGDQSLSGSTYTVKGAGNDIWGSMDTFHFVWQQITGDTTINARVISQTNTDPWAKAGLMMRLSTDTAAANYSVFVTPQNGIIVQYRNFSGFTSFAEANVAGSVPSYIQISRFGSTYTAYTSPDGTNWTFIPGSTVTIIGLSGTISAGIAVTSHNGGSVSNASFDSINIINSAPTPPNICPGTWTCEDIGFPTPSGDQSFQQSTWTIDGGGADIWDTIDSFRYIYQSISGDATVSARIVSQTNSNDWAKAGMMIRLTDDQSSPYYGIFKTPTNGVVIQYRLTAGGSSQQITSGVISQPVYVKINKNGTTYSASTSTDGNTWTQVSGSSISIGGLSGTILAGMAITAHNTVDSSQVVFDNVIINGQVAISGCPNNWTCTDIGSPLVSGSTTFTNNTFSLNGAGNDIWTTDDQFQYVFQTLTGDGEILAKINSQTNTDPWAKAGVMIKEAAVTGAKYVLLAVTPGNGLRMQYNFTNELNGGTYAFPIWVKVKRTGNVFKTFSSVDGANWTQVGVTTLAMNSSVTAGLFVTSHNGNQASTATFNNVSLNIGSSLPGSLVDSDIGQPILSGSASYNSGIYSVNGAGNDIWTTDDQFNFVNQPLNGDGSITARITSQGNTDPWAKAGVMIKESLTTGAKYVLLAVTPGNGLRMQYNFTNELNGGTYALPNTWIKLTRFGNTFSTYKSTDGLNWSIIGSTNFNMNSNSTIGLFVTSHSSDTLGSATFDNVSVSLGGTLQTGWSNKDIGSPALGGSSDFNNGIFTVSGAGNDIWQNMDQFQYMYKTVNGDTTIISHIISQTNTDPWAKAGIMIKESATSLSPYVLVGITPGNGLRTQYNFTSDVSGGAYDFPQWVKLVRAGNNFTSFISVNGTVWTQVGQATLNINASATAGLFVTSHNGNQISTATFDNTSITNP